MGPRLIEFLASVLKHIVPRKNTGNSTHIQDPILFTKSLLFTLEHGRQGFDRDRKPFTNHYTTVGYYYVDHPEGDIPAIPAYRDRVPVLIPLPADDKK